MKMLTRLALKNNKKNKTRSILIMLVIFLSTTLLSSIALGIKFRDRRDGGKRVSRKMWH